LANIDFAALLIGLSVLVMSLTVHEAAHAWSADHLGDSLARRLGRLSLNPAVHIDPIGTIVFPLVAILTGLPIIGWAKPVPVNAAALGRDWRQKFTLIAAAGPISNLAMAVAAAILFRVMPSGGADSPFFYIVSILETAVYVNVLLAVFNLVPVPPLDGGNVVAGLLSGAMADQFDRLRPYGFLILYGLMLTGMLSAIISPPASVLLSWLL
jgi:Zn-dependent protease